MQIDHLKGCRPHSETCPRWEMGCISVCKSGPRLGLTGLRYISKSLVLCWGSEEKHLWRHRSWGRMSNNNILCFHPHDRIDKWTPYYLCGDQYNTWRMGPYNCTGWNKYTTCLPRLPKVSTVTSTDAWGLEHTSPSTSKSQWLISHHWFFIPFPPTTVQGSFSSVKLGFVFSKRQGSPGVELYEQLLGPLDPNLWLGSVGTRRVCIPDLLPSWSLPRGPS